TPSRLQSDDLAHLIRHDSEGNFTGIWSAACQRLSEMDGLSDIDFWRHWWFVRIDDSLDHDRTRSGERLAQNFAAVLGFSNAEACRPKALCQHGEVDRLQLADVFGVTEEDHLLPFDLAKCVVLDD